EADVLKQKLLELILENVPAERASVIILDVQTRETVSVYARDRNQQPSDFALSNSILHMLFNDRSAILSSDIVQDATSPAVNSLIAVPFMTRERIFGVLYMDTLARDVRFDQSHLELASALGNIAAVSLDNIRYSESILQDQNQLLEALRTERTIIGESSALLSVLATMSKASRADSTILIFGESGTGKELAARAIHLSSARSHKPFTAINCANLSETLLESELFGHEKGAFTGAYEQKKGKLEIAEGGTVFLDEISELAPALQARILRVLQEREFERIGGNHTIKTDIRLIAATNKNLEEAIGAGKFRDDLFYRLNVIQIIMPPLRERREDIPLLASYFVSIHSKKCGRKIIGISPDARSCLQNYDWPGNVRQLENVIERAVVLGSENLIQLEDLPDEITDNTMSTVTKYQDLLRESKKKMILEALDHAKGNLVEAARILGIRPNNLRRTIAALKIKSVDH
ncbi:MAG: sigma-54-dependent Fis family transcriptional regulator, partial [Acidobacteria bacterium]